MPLYDYKCEECGFAQEEMHKMRETLSSVCPKCHGERYTKQITGCHINFKEFQKPIEMYSIAASTDEEIASFRNKCPDVEISSRSSDPMYGIPIARSRRDKLQALKAVGFEEH